VQREFETRTPSLAASTELLVMAPIKPGFVPTLDTITYKSRVKLLLKMLHAGRQSQHEYRLLRAVSDAVERVGVIRSLRVAVVEGRSASDDRILLSVHFDGSYEAYARTIWQRAARLLDLIFCNADGYTTGWDHPFDDWNAWIRSVQIPTPFFYATPGLTYPDQTYLLMLERRDRGEKNAEEDRTRIFVPAAEEVAWSILNRHNDPTKALNETESDRPRAVTAEVIRQNLGALAGLYRLADWYRLDCPDGEILLRAAHELLPQMRDVFLGENQSLPQAFLGAAWPALSRQVDWFLQGINDVPICRKPEDLPKAEPDPCVVAEVQGGILSAYEGVTDGVLVLLAFANTAAAASFLRQFSTTWEGDSAASDAIRANLALTLEGLRACGLSQAQIAALPLEFRQGMAARAGLLGDVRWNHPRRWVLPRRYRGPDLDPSRVEASCPVVPLESVHAVVQFRAAAPKGIDRADSVKSLKEAIESLPGLKDASVQLLSAQWLTRQLDDSGQTIDHFGYTDGQSQPQFQPSEPPPENYPNQVHLGEVLVGHANSADRAADLAVNREPVLRALLRNGSFLVVRKLHQEVRRFRDLVAHASSANKLDPAHLQAMMMGRWPADAKQPHKPGDPLASHGRGGLNDFNYLGDESGDCTPLAAHIRRANPRALARDPDNGEKGPSRAPGGRAPRIVRRSLPFGPVASQDSDDLERGLMFMAYNSSIAEQFEVIQGWLAGGNSSRGYSGATCPFLGVSEAGLGRNFRFLHPDTRKTVHMKIDGSEDLGAEPKPLVSLQWGLYAFAPSRSGQALLADIAARANGVESLPWSVERGQALIDGLRRVESSEGASAGASAWKAALEDPEALSRFDSASVWAAVRQLHGGLLRIPYGVLVASPRLVDTVLRDEQRYTVQGYRSRLVQAGMGPIFLSRDADDPAYDRLSRACNRAIESIGMRQAFDRAQSAARRFLDERTKTANDNASSADEPEWECAVDVRDLITDTLAVLCEAWFGLDSSTLDPLTKTPLFKAGSLDWNWKPGMSVHYPGQFTAASRATFQPEPSSEVLKVAREHGLALTAALHTFLEIKIKAGPIDAPITRAVVDALWASERQDAVHTIAGAMMGFLPTTEGMLRRVFAEWTRDGTMLALSSQTAELPGSAMSWSAAKDVLEGPLRSAIKFRPVPEQIWREARVSHRITGDDDVAIHVNAGDRMILGQVSALHAQLEEGDESDVGAAFGGHRGLPGQSHPTHACPGYEAAMGTMIGLTAAIVCPRTARLVQGSAPGVLVFRGRTESAPSQRQIPQYFSYRAGKDTETSPGEGGCWWDSVTPGCTFQSSRRALTSEEPSRTWDTTPRRSRCIP